jgi:hypothetical protein
MTTFPGSPRLLKGGIVLIDPETAAVRRIIALQYNPKTISRTLQVQGVGEGGDRSEALRLKGPLKETYKPKRGSTRPTSSNFPNRIGRLSLHSNRVNASAQTAI